MKADKPTYFWWKEGIIYQIYPRSFYDASGDGIGDLRGITEKLDYIKNLGITGIWLSPINQSPMFDFGYDISDYRKIDPAFGTLEDMNLLITEAHKRGIKIILDLVINHTSHLHPWFIESRSSRTNSKRDWYIWHDGKNGKVPNNWMASFGGRAWEWDKETSSYYLHTFLPQQPDVNWRNNDLKKAMFGEISFWLDRGVDGFRLDVVNWFIKDAEFRNNPATLGRYPRPYDLQKHIYDRDRPETHDIIRDFRKLLDSYDERMSVGEVFHEKPGNHALSASYLGNGEDELHLAFDFSLVFEKWDARRFFQRIEGVYKALPEAGWPCFVLSNHDNPRSATRFGKGAKGKARAKAALTLLLTLKGTPFLYYGEEIGMVDGQIKRQDIVDPVGKRYWPFNKGRDSQRRPMQWTSGPWGGFSRTKPWLPLHPDYADKNVEAQEINHSSLLNYVKGLTALRNTRTALRRGSWQPLDKGEANILSYYRTHEKEGLFILINFKGKQIDYTLPERLKVLYSTHRQPAELAENTHIKLFPWEASVFEAVRE